ncbi:hypothetical protein B0T19DRAFT_268685 [Cercophora scortea]|uniref:UBZ4-type domain-containing protein n=1 Tax=Cercophora scortea TaxID=314031 RepID=A0AAE0M4V8_9PEZI|nr:hypothetical protein B0T19DRAFT_268685 [Cercophora scortea]
MQRVPTIRDVIPGAQVNIVLKQDQPTGRTVSGTVQNVLTRGNHPRGIKVRLADGRVGRVQTMATGTENAPAPSQQGSDGRLGRPRPDQHDRDLPPPPRVGLDAYLKPTKRQRAPHPKSGAAASGSTAATSASSTTSDAIQDRQDFGDAGDGATAGDEMAICPVCGDFRGDEAAVAHHVASHFDE